MIGKRVYITALFFLLSFFPLICQTADDAAHEEERTPAEVSEDTEVSEVSETSAAAEPETEEKDSLDEKHPAPSPRPVAPSSGITLLDITDPLLYDSRIPDIKLEKREVMVADIDEPAVNDLAEDNTVADSESAAVKGGTEKDDSFRTMNKAVKLWLPRTLIILLILILVVLYNSKSKKKRRRVFRKIPSKRRL